MEHFCAPIQQQDRIAKILFWSGLCLLIVFDFISSLGMFRYTNAYVTISGLVNVLGKIPLLLLALKVLLTERFWFVHLDNCRVLTQFLILISLGLVFMISYLISRNLTMLKGLLLVLSARDMNLQKVWKGFFVTFFACSCVVIVMNALNLLPQFEVLRVPGSEEVRNSLGFAHPNVLGMAALALCSLLLILRGKSITWWEIGSFLLVAVIIQLVAVSRSAVTCIALLAILASIQKKWSETILSSRRWKWMVLIFVPVMASISYILTIFFNSQNSLMLYVSKLLSNRLESIHALIENYGFSILGQHIDMMSTMDSMLSGEKALTLDNGYLYIGIIFGVPTLVVFLIAYVSLVKHMFEQGNLAALIVLLIFAVNGLTENYMLDVLHNPGLIALSTLITAKPTTSSPNMKELKNDSITQRTQVE